MSDWNILIARSAQRAQELIQLLELGDDWKGFGYFDALTGWHAKKLVIFDFRETYVDIEKADYWLDHVARLRLLPGCADNVWTA